MHVRSARHRRTRRELRERLALATYRSKSRGDVKSASRALLLVRTKGKHVSPLRRIQQRLCCIPPHRNHSPQNPTRMSTVRARCPLQRQRSRPQPFCLNCRVPGGGVGIGSVQEHLAGDDAEERAVSVVRLLHVSDAEGSSSSSWLRQ